VFNFQLIALVYPRQVNKIAYLETGDEVFLGTLRSMQIALEQRIDQQGSRVK
jgi:hypothetical protein